MPAPFTLPASMIEEARRQRENTALSEISSSIDKSFKQGMSALETVARGAAEQISPLMQALQSGQGLQVPDIESLGATNDAAMNARASWEREQAARQTQTTTMPSSAPPAASGTPSAMPQISATGGGAPASGGPSRIAGAGTRASRFAGQIAKISAEEGVPEDVLAALIDTENSDENSVSPAGARGIGQVVPGQGYDLPGEDASDPETSIRQMARAAKDKFRITGGDWNEVGAAYFGYGTDAGGMDTDTYRSRYQQNRARYQNLPENGQTTAGVTPQRPVDRGTDLYPRQDLLDDPDKWAVCGPLGVMAFAAMRGQPVDYETAKKAATDAGWTSAGMKGPQSQVAALRNIGIAAKTGPIDLETITREVRNGNPVGLSSPGESGHYFTVQGVDEQGRLDLGNSALSLTASKGRRWFTVDELRQLGAIGNVDTAIYMDNPASPTPSVAASAPNAASAAPQPAAAVSPPPPATPAQPTPAPVSAGSTSGDEMVTVTIPNSGGQTMQVRRGSIGEGPGQYKPSQGWQIAGESPVAMKVSDIGRGDESFSANSMSLKADDGADEYVDENAGPREGGREGWNGSAGTSSGAAIVPTSQTPEPGQGDDPGQSQPLPPLQTATTAASEVPFDSPMAPTAPAASMGTSSTSPDVQIVNGGPPPADAQWTPVETTQRPQVEIADGRTTAPTPGGDWQEVQTAPKPAANKPLPLYDENGDKVGYVQGMSTQEGDIADSRQQDEGAREATPGSVGAQPLPASWQVNPADQVDPRQAGALRPEDLPNAGGAGRGWNPAAPRPQGGIQIPDAMLNTMVPRAAQTPALTPQEDPNPPSRWSPQGQPSAYRQQPAEEAAAEIERDQQYQAGPPSNPLERAVSATGSAPFFREKPAEQAVSIYETIQSLPFDAYAAARRQLISDAEARNMTGIDPIAPLRAAFPDAPWPSVETLNPDKRPASDVLYGMLIAGALPDPMDPIVATGLNALRNPASRAAIGAVAGAALPSDTTEGRIANATTGAGVALGGPRAVRVAGRAAGKGVRSLAEEGARQLMDLTPSPGVIERGTGGLPPRRSLPTVEVLESQIENARNVAQRAREMGNTAQERRAMDVAWSLESDLVDARNARRNLEPAIESDIGRRVERMPYEPDVRTDPYTTERVANADDLSGPVSLPTNRPGMANGTAGFAPSRALVGDLGNSLGGGIMGSATGAAAPADTEEERRRNAGIGLAAGLIGAPIAGRIAGRYSHGGALGTLGFGPNRPSREPGRTFALGNRPGEKVEFNVKVVPLSSLVTSHTDSLSINRAFPAELQPRVRERAASQVQIDRIVQSFDPDQLLIDTHRLDSGPMIVGEGNVVESGNGRSIALRRLAKEDPEAYARYVETLKAELPEYGLTEDALKGIDQPVLVRERVTPMTPAERAQYAADANVGSAARMAPVEQAMQDAGRISDDSVARIVVGEDQTIDEALMSGENGGFRRAFMATVPESEWGELLTADGNLNPRGLARVKDALLAKTYQGSAGARLAVAFVDSLDSGIKNVQHGIMGSLPTVSRVEARISAGEIDPALSIANDMAVAADVYSRLRRRKTILRDYLAQSGMFEGRETTPFQDRLLAYLDENARSPKRIRAMLDEYARAVDGMAGADQVDMFGTPLPQSTKEEVLDDVFRRLGGDAGADTGADLGRAGAGSDVVEGAERGLPQSPDPRAGAADSGGAGIPRGGTEQTSSGPKLTPEQQIERFRRAQAARAAPTSATGVARPQPSWPGPVADDLLPATGGPEGRLEIEGAPRPRPANLPPVADDLLPRGGPDGTLEIEGAPRPRPAFPGPVDPNILPGGGPEGTLVRPMALPSDPTHPLNVVAKRVSRLVKGDQPEADRLVGEFKRLMDSGASPGDFAEYWRNVEAHDKISPGEVFSLYRRFNMLSGPRTFETNGLTGALNLGYELAGQGVQQVARGRLAEAGAEVAAPLRAAGKAFGNLVETLRHGVTTEQAARGDIPRTLSSRADSRAGRVALTAMEVPDRLNAAVDQFYRTLTEEWAATTTAHRMARSKGIRPSNPKWSETVAENLDAIRANPARYPDIKAAADRVTFFEDATGLVKWLEDGKRKYPNLIGFVAPFIRTPANIASRAVDISPLGAPRAAFEAATGLGRGRKNLAPRVRDNIIGMAATYWAYDQAQQGNITGAGPDDPEKLALLRATGWQPYSIKIGDRYWSYANFAPFSLALSTGAAAYEAQKYAKEGKTDTLSLLSDGAARTGKVVTDMTVLAGLGSVVKSIQDPDRYGAQWLTQSLTQLIPAGSFLNTVGQATDDVVRRSERDTVGNQLVGGLKARVPGLRQQVPAAQDPLGRDVPNEQTGTGALNPFRPTTERADPSLQPFIDAGVDIGKPRETLTVRAGTPPITLSPEEQRRWNTLRGEQIQRFAPQIGRAENYRVAGKQGQEIVLKRLLNQATEAADRLILSEMGNAEIRRRMTESLQKKAS